MGVEEFRPNWDKPTPSMFNSHDEYLKWVEYLETEHIKEDTLEINKLKKEIKEENCPEDIKENTLELINDVCNYAIEYVDIIRQLGNISKK